MTWLTRQGRISSALDGPRLCESNLFGKRWMGRASFEELPSAPRVGQESHGYPKGNNHDGPVRRFPVAVACVATASLRHPATGQRPATTDRRRPLPAQVLHGTRRLESNARTGGAGDRSSGTIPKHSPIVLRQPPPRNASTRATNRRPDIACELGPRDARGAQWGPASTRSHERAYSGLTLCSATPPPSASPVDVTALY